jgi:hypothetical protein
MFAQALADAQTVSHAALAGGIAADQGYRYCLGLLLSALNEPMPQEPLWRDLNEPTAMQLGLRLPGPYRQWCAQVGRQAELQELQRRQAQAQAQEAVATRDTADARCAAALRAAGGPGGGEAEETVPPTALAEAGETARRFGFDGDAVARASQALNDVRADLRSDVWSAGRGSRAGLA